MTPRPLHFILATILIDAIGVGLIFPLMPDLMDRVGAGGVSNGAVLGGILMAAYAATQFLCAPAVGGLSDAIGRKPVLLVALATLAVDYVIMALATSFWLLLVGRLLAGVAGATYITATAYLADISPPEKRAANFGLIGATFGIGFVLGPAFGGLLAGIDVTAPFWVAAALSAANVGFGLAVLPESLPPEKRRAFRASDLNPFGAIRDAFRLPELALPLSCMFVFEFANMVYPTLWAFWGRANFGWSAAIIGVSLATYGVGVAITQAVVLPALLKRMSEFRVLLIALCVGIVAAFAFGLMEAAWMVAVVLPIACLSDMAPPTLTAIMANVTSDDRQGVLQGVIASLGSLAAIFAPLIMTPVFRSFSGPDAALRLPGAPFLMAGLLLVALVPVVLKMRPVAQSS
ncbi:MFS transporter [Maritimibacter sp. UBA3975]|uniref:MFS transporter n=1 Tax=Maritimibacter sp. UBA3975 TaxID=1946833 RepID=UPI000C098E99|nr:MFS transporter [Maritimibacter sp. UBA3975]MAM63018.1 tetracycline resistance MFS efflux pump [Maritimibacter sp.]|tara:strand:+ start:51371 stop:52579 length:1209 start_codon:yes stop_codon:yes gene_type:complete